MIQVVRIAYILLFAGVVSLAVIALVVVATSVREHQGPTPHTVRHLKDIPAEAKARLSDKRIFFGHQSVGSNIVAGIQDLVGGGESPSLTIVTVKDVNEIQSPMLAHASIGKNRYPESKIAEFKRLMEGGLGDRVDIAFFKFCYVDMGKDSNPEAILATYCETMDALKTRFLRVKFVHVTVPLRGLPEGMEGLETGINRLLGRPSVLDDNQVRMRYNSLLRERYSGKEPLFDLALYETLGPGDRRHYSLKGGQEVPILARSYTDDGGHLNAAGRRHVAEQLLVTLVDLTGGSS